MKAANRFFMRRRFFRWMVLPYMVISLPLVLFLGYLALKDYAKEFAEKKGEFVDARLQPAGMAGEGERYWLTLRGSGGLTVECGMLVPPGKGVRFPAFILLGGKTTGKYAVDYAIGVKDVIIVAPDYPFTPRESYSLPEVMEDLPKIREALLDMVPSVQLALDYLWTRQDVDTGKVVMLGYSFGAPYVPYLASRDRRLKVAVMVYGGGDLRSLIRHNVRRFEGPVFSELVGGLAGVLLYPLEPLRYIEDVSPAPVVMINGEQDEQVPRENAEMLYKAAREPKQITWLPSRHVHPRDTTLTLAIIGALASELTRLGVLPAAATP